MPRELTHFSLFTGIGGIDLAAEWAGFTTVGQCEFADYPTKVLEKHWPDVPRWRDVRNVTAESVRKRIGGAEITLLSGGFPCQPHSLAGERKASTDERDLWPEFRRVISEITPKWILGENVPGILTSESGRFFRGILRDLSELGYSTAWCTYGANAVGAFHLRERTIFISHTDSQSGALSLLNRNSQESRKGDQDTEKRGKNRKFIEVGTQIDSGIPTQWGSLDKPRLVRTTSRLSPRVDEIRNRLTCLGNAVVPQQVYPILKAIAEIERCSNNG